MYKFLIVSFVVSFAVNSLAFDSRSRLNEETLITNFKPDKLVGYYAYTPPEYDTNKTKKFALLVFLHGKDESSNIKDGPSFPKMRSHGPMKEIYNNKWDPNLPLIVISPQTWQWQASWNDKADFIDEFIEDAKRKYRIDTSRIYLTGLSAGGGGAMNYTNNYSHKVAAVMPIAGWGGPTCDKYDDIAYWGFHNSGDGVIQPSGTENVYNTLMRCKDRTAETKKTIYQAGGHDAWTKTYNNTATSENIYYWLLKFKKGSTTPVNRSPILTAIADVSITQGESRVVSISATDPDGDTITLGIEKAPAFVSIQNHGNGQGELEISPSNDKAAQYEVVVTAKDSKGAVSKHSFKVTVQEAYQEPGYDDASRVVIDFGSIPDEEANNVSSQNALTSLKNMERASTKVNVSISGFNKSQTNGTTAPGYNTGLTPEISEDSFFGNHVAFEQKTAPKGLIKITGLNKANKYKISLFASQMNVSKNLQTKYTVRGSSSSTVYLDVHNNTSALAIADGILPNSQGEILIDVEKGPNNNDSYGFFYIGALILEGLDETDLVPVSPGVPSELKSGLMYKHYHGQWSKLPDFSKLTTVKSGVVSQVTLSPRTKDDHFAFVFEGHLKIETAGSYTLSIASDDGSKLYVNDKLEINNDGSHSLKKASKTLTLKAGLNKIRLEYFEGSGGETLEFTYSGPGFSEKTVPASVLFHGDANSSNPEPDPVPTPDPGTELQPGLSYKHYHGQWSKLPDFSKLTAVKSGVVSQVTLSPRTKDDHFAFVFEGHLKIETAGSYTLSIASDDGSKLYVNDKLEIDNDGSHSLKKASKTLALKAGLNKIRIEYFEGAGGETLEFTYSGPGFSEKTVPASALFHGDPDSSNPNPNPDPVEQIQPGLSYKHYHGQWSKLPDFSKLTAVKSGVVSQVTLSPRTKEDHFAFVFEGYLNVDVAGNYTLSIASDDGSKLYVNDKLEVDNDGSHSLKKASKTLALKAGLNKIRIEYFEGAGGETLEFTYSGPGISERIVPASVLFHEE